MSEPTRKRSEDREKDLRLAILRIERGRAHTKETKVSIASVAREAGVSTALIHNHYPKVAEDIRTAVGRCSRTQRDAKHEELKTAQGRNKELRQEIEQLTLLVKNLASENEMLIMENRMLRATQGESNVKRFPETKRPEST
jgi:AcrR family transcriptional regulator